MPCLDQRIIRGNPVACGNCTGCARVRRWKIVSRIVAESFAAEKTLFLTFTLRRNMSERIGYRLVQRFLKRLRKKHAVRYACVAEHGSKMARLHFHMLLHGGVQLTDKSVRKHWRGGISHSSVVGSTGALGAARYGTKMARYSTKGGGRFRFSQGYGSRAIPVVVEKPVVRSVIDAFPGAEIVAIGGVRLPDKLRGRQRLGTGYTAIPPELRVDAHETRVAMLKESRHKSRLGSRFPSHLDAGLPNNKDS